MAGLVRSSSWTQPSPLSEIALLLNHRHQEPHTHTKKNSWKLGPSGKITDSKAPPQQKRTRHLLMSAINDENTPVDSSAPELLLDQHVKYIQALDTVCHMYPPRVVSLPLVSGHVSGTDN